jgi:protein-disulfide isomerase
MATLLKVPIHTSDHVQGSRNAPAILLEYGDFECPHCGRAHYIVKRLQQTFQHRIAFVFRNFPLSNIHPHAELAAEGAEAAGARGKFWQMHDWLFEHQEDLDLENIVEAAEAMRLDTVSFLSDIENEVCRDKIRADFMGGVRSGVNGTPTFFVNGVRHDADYELETLAAAIHLAVAQVA